MSKQRSAGEIMRAETIYAVATGAGRAAIAVVRISGPDSRALVRLMAGRVPEPRQADLVTLRHPSTHDILDRCLLLFFEGPKSETGEDSAEFHLHGSRAVLAAVLDVLAALPNVRQAEPGEFARRSFLNGKADLAQMEGLADLLDAETQWQRRQAQRQLSGAMRDVTGPWRAILVQASAQIETAIDFTDDVDLAETVHGTVIALLWPVLKGLRHELGQAKAAERVRDGVQIVIAGPPNAGKSTLLNALAKRDAAIVSTIAGTTRDPIEVHMDFDGCPVTLVDTAGLRDSSDSIEQIGISRARSRADEADLLLWLSEDGRPPEVETSGVVWSIVTKADAIPPDRRQPETFYLSTETGENLAALLDRLADYARGIAQSGAMGLLTRTRHRQAFEAAEQALVRIVGDTSLPVELMAEELRAARFALERLIGTVDVEDILGDIFSRFCIGK
ncbi:tRNA uridine-5-carboxymethylaminomethyl(34) synthesis GTPase MnmE [Beijerinckia sp. L45]|uniref:tRNA uridine-5-carboxymethylaminomethyl(34) synthesis GTPase MnmE n=1 Tax=Beijerinckia sp. L45 TaxID=1641855 RepID=UPI001FED7565|nr:tRNA uridine-5-carboxymethylaminomethyl(34) synthesis GTPase MnmE [Beijerinckia sp. L45]